MYGNILKEKLQIQYSGSISGFKSDTIMDGLLKIS